MPSDLELLMVGNGKRTHKYVDGMMNDGCNRVSLHHIRWWHRLIHMAVGVGAECLAMCNATKSNGGHSWISAMWQAECCRFYLRYLNNSNVDVYHWAVESLWLGASIVTFILLMRKNRGPGNEYGLNVSLKNTPVGAPTAGVIVLGGGAFGRELGLEEFERGNSHDGISASIKRGRDKRAAHFLPTSAPRKGHVGTQ